MPNRILREGILTSDRIDQLDAPAEVFYRRLMSKVDDFGLHDARPSILRSFLYPLRADRVREADIARWIAACEKAGVIALYEHGGKPYLQMLDVGWPTRSEPKCPLPTDPGSKPMQTVARNCEQPQATAPVFVGVGGDVGGKPPHPPAEGADGFDRFWNAWPKHPRKVAQAQCRRKWETKDCEPIADRIVAHVEAMKHTEQWQKDGAQFIPAPLVYLNQERWIGATDAQDAAEWFETPKGVSAKGVELGIGAWSEADWVAGRMPDYPTYRARVLNAAGHSPRAAA